ncbi:hypothetical protein LJC19_07040 [Oxalobacter sp. OttesenSCG-928-P03]|nr:hypothetical protein [Oxalobacter sp. OttesenSCG-928-P03]
MVVNEKEVAGAPNEPVPSYAEVQLSLSLSQCRTLKEILAMIRVPSVSDMRASSTIARATLAKGIEIVDIFEYVSERIKQAEAGQCSLPLPDLL